MTAELAKAQPAPLAPFDPGAAINAIIEKGITGESVAVLKDLFDLRVKIEEREGRKSFARAFADLQAACAPIKATKAIPNRDGTIRSTFAPFEEIWANVKPLLTAGGFSVTFDQDIDDKGRTVVKCRLIHCDGHEISNSQTVRGGGGPPGCTDAQVDGGNTTFAKRYALCNMLGITIDHDMDARDEGEPISPEQAADIERRVKAIGGDTARFLEFAGADSFASIMTSRLPGLMREIERRERAAKPPQSTPAPVEPAAAPLGGEAPGPVVPEPPCSFDSATDWRDAMLEAMGDRWSLDKPAAAVCFEAMLKKGKYTTYLTVPPEARRKAWDALHTGGLEKFKTPI